MDIAELKQKSVAELHTLAEQLNITNYSGLRKQDLIFRIEQSLLDYFHPLKGGEDGLGWPFAGTIYYSRVNQRCFTVPGVASVTTLVIVLDGLFAVFFASVGM